MKDIIEILQLDFKSGLLAIAGIIILFTWIISKWDFIVSKFGITTKRVMKEDKQDKDIEELKNHSVKTDKSMDKILECINELKESIQGVSNQVKSLQQKNDKNEAARLKDRIAEAYRYWHERGEWTSRDKESMEDMIAAYSQYSENSFVHTIVEKEMMTWSIIDD